MRMKLNKIACIVITASLLLPSARAMATSTSDQIKQVEQEQQSTKEQLGQAQNTIEDLKDSKQAIQKSLNNLNEQLDEKSEEMDNIEDQIAAKEQEISDIELEYEKAVEQADEQYQFIKARIKTIYESGSNDIYDLIFNSGTMADFLNKAAYIARMNDYDKKMMNKLQSLMEEAQAQKDRLVVEDQELQQLYNDKEEEVGNLEELVDSTENSLVSYAGAISEKEKEALAYEAKLVASQSTLASLKNKLKEEEELAKQAEKMAFRDISEVSVAAGDRDLLAAIIQCEAGGEPYAGKIAVGAVIMNRVRSGAFPNTIAGVVYQPMQFQPVRSGRLAIRLSEGANETCYKAADEVMAGANNIGNCLFFRTVVPGIKGTIIGHHVFYLHWTGVASGYGTVEESIDGDVSESKAEYEADQEENKKKTEEEKEDEEKEESEEEEDEDEDEEEAKKIEEEKKAAEEKKAEEDEKKKAEEEEKKKAEEEEKKKAEEEEKKKAEEEEKKKAEEASKSAEENDDSESDGEE